MGLHKYATSVAKESVHAHYAFEGMLNYLDSGMNIQDRIKE